LSDNEADYDSDDDIVGEAVYSEEYLQKRKQRRKASSSSGSEGDEEYNWNEDNVEDEEEDDEEDSMSVSEDSDKPRKFKRLAGRTRRETKLRSVDEIQSGLRRSKRATQKRINYRQLEMSDSETEFIKPDKSNASDDHSDPTENGEYMMESEDSDGNDDEEQETKDVEPVTYPAEGNSQYPAVEENEQSQIQPPEKSSSPGQEEVEGTTKRRFLDLNELAPSSGFDDGPNTTTKDEGNDDL